MTKRTGQSVWMGAGLAMALVVPMVSDAQSRIQLGSPISVRAPAFVGYPFRVSDSASAANPRSALVRVVSSDVEVYQFTFIGSSGTRSVRSSQSLRGGSYSTAVSIPSVGSLRTVIVHMKNVGSGSATVTLLGQR